MTWFIFANPLQAPFDPGSVDDGGRILCIFNVHIRKTSSTTFLEELAAILEAAGVGTRNVDLFASNASAIPSGPGPFLSITDTGGMTPDRVHNQSKPKYENPTVKVVARASTYAAARTLAWAAYDALVVVKNVEVTP